MKKGFELQLTNEEVAFIEERNWNLAKVMTDKLKESLLSEITKDLDINVQTNENGAYTRGEFWILKRNQIQEIIELLGEGNYSKFFRHNFKMKIFIEEYKGYKIFFNKDDEKFEFEYEVLGIIKCTFLRLLKEDIDKYSESKFISPVRACDIRREARYVDILGFSQNGDYIVKYEDNPNIVFMVSTAGKQYYLEESQWIVDKIKKYEEQIEQIKDNIEDLKSSIKTIESLKL